MKAGKVPNQFVDQQDARGVRYPWKLWMSEPFRPYILEPGEDFPLGLASATGKASTAMYQRLWLHAKRHNLGLACRLDDPTLQDRVLFCFYRDRRPALYWSLISTASDDPTNVLTEENSVQCFICNTRQARAPHLLHIKECLMRNPQSPADPALYATHRDMLKIDLGMSWSEKKGPHNDH